MGVARLQELLPEMLQYTAAANLIKTVDKNGGLETDRSDIG